MKTIRAWMLLALVVLAAMMPIAANADDRGVAQQTVEDNWVDEVPTPWFCVIEHPVGVCFPPW